METLATKIKIFESAIRLSRFLPRKAMTRLRYLFFIMMILSVIALVTSSLLTPGLYETKTIGLSLIFLGLWLEQVCLYIYHNSFYFRGLDSIVGQEAKTKTGITYEVAEMTLGNPDDLTGAFFSSKIGQHILARLNIATTEYSNLLDSARHKITSQDIPLQTNQTTTLIDISRHLYMYDIDLQQWLTKQAVTREIFQGAVNFVVKSHHAYKRQLRWWSRDQLSHTVGIADELAYGTAFELEKFSRNLYDGAVYSDLGGSAPHTQVLIEKIEQILARSKASNVLLIGNAGVGKMDILIQVAKRFKTGKGLNSLSGQHLILLDSEQLFALCSEPTTLEQELITMLNQAAEAGNVSVVIENIGNFITKGASLGVSIPELLDTYLAIPNLHIIGTDSPNQYHNVIEPLGAFAKRFEEILVEPADIEHTTTILEPIALQEEVRHKIFFIYEAIETITKSADRYLTEGAMPDKAITLLVEIASNADRENVSIITPEYIHTYISNKTGIPVGPMNDDERDTLMHLEDKLHERIVDQVAAVSAIARTMRRARADIERSDKPIGSFLFLGPTGVGKTETAKALAEVFFGSEDTMVRFDMSEFSGEDALERLIGGFQRTGALSDRLQEHPYTLVLLDEFEKANVAVHDLFLQILDEGYFTDNRGNRVNLRNAIIIATSNAGSDLISHTSNIRTEQPLLNQNIIDHIIKARILKPELINRFDSTIVFEPLTESAQHNITRLMLNELTDRIQTRGYNIVINADVIPLLVERGFDARFGARPLQRVIQNLVEEKIAKLIITGSLQKGDTIDLNLADFTSEELAATTV